MTETAREQILAAVDAITDGGDGSFSLADVIAELRRRQTTLSESTIRVQICSRMCDASFHYQAKSHADFERIDRGVYRLQKDGPLRVAGRARS